MRTLVLMRGASGCGKSTYIKERGLEPYTISSDTLRLMIDSIDVNIEGDECISQTNNSLVWKMLFQILEKRMQNGEFTIIDSTNAKTSDMKKLKKLAQQYRYRIYCVDMTNVDIDECKKRNTRRELYKRVNDSVIDKQYEQIKNSQIPSGITVIDPICFSECLLKCIDLSEYDNIHVFGDIHGCYEPLKEYFKDGINDNDFYIFCGDYIDRGIQNAEVLNFIMPLSERRNFLFLEGNHECHLNKWANDEKAWSSEFENETRPQLDKMGISKKEVRQFYRRLGQCALFEYNGQIFSVTHGGLPCVPNTFISSRQMIHGVGNYLDAESVDNAFYDKYIGLNYNYYTIHGHRNMEKLPVKVNDRAFNLEGAVEFGGTLRILKITPDEIIPIEIENKIYKSFDYGEINRKIPTGNIEATIEALRSTKLVKEHKFGNISSFNFTRNAFDNNLWSDVTMKARGLFINTKTNQIVSRGYEKFFKINQRPETQLGKLKENLKFPIKISLKEDGFLGLLGYDEETDDLIFSSKAMLDGQHSKYFQNIFNQLFDKRKKDELKKYFKNENKSMAFEVIDPVHDPHIIEYNKSQMILLDIFDRKIEMSKLSYDDLKSVANKFGFEVKDQVQIINSWEDFMTWYQTVISPNYNLKIEGFVVEDATGFMFKVKTYYYDTWKWLNIVADSVMTYGRYHSESKFTDPIHFEFYKWICNKKDNNESIPTNIISIRKVFIEEQQNKIISKD